MATVWANKLMNDRDNKWTWADVPAARKPAVKEILRARVEAGALTPDRYESITGEAYPAPDEGADE